MDALTAFEKQQNMPCVTSAERIGIQKGQEPPFGSTPACCAAA
jgi:hypothetical protein